MSKNIEYSIAIGHSLAELEDVVSNQLNQGWKPQGGVSEMRIRHPEDTQHVGDGYAYVQAMIREKD